MDIDNFVINDGNKDLVIYPLLEINKNEKNYIVYSDTKEVEKISSLYVGEVTENGELIPVDDNMINKFETEINDAFEKVREQSNT